MKNHRIFIAINLPENIKDELIGYKVDLPAKWTKRNNLHITMSFLGNVSDEELFEVCQSVKEIAFRHDSFNIGFTNIVYNPSNNSPKMIWAVGEKTKEFISLKKDIDDVLGNSENKGFNPHVTLARIRKWDWQRIEPEERPEIEQNIDLSFSVKSIEVMESFLKKGGPEYVMIESYKLL
jgi:2'-5' RNA ligase